MRFAFDEDQLALRDAVRDLLVRECTPTVVRAAWAGDFEPSAKAWSALATMGALAVMTPEADGGLGLTEVDAVLLAEAAGAAALAEPIVDTMLVAAPWGLVRDAERAVVVVPESPLTAYADRADVVITLAADGARAIPAAQCRLTPHHSVDGARTLFEIATPADATTARPVADAALAFRRGVLGTAAQLLGLSDRMLELTVGYVQQREQFGVKIGTFQAVKHHLANARTKLEFARPLVYRAAASLAHRDADAGTHTSMAKVQAGVAARATARAALQCHGAIGYTTEYDLHLFMKRTWALDAAWGDRTWHRRAVSRAILERGD
jgi:alkylation response protein AidB-like acyl-CoA dehydrogenase